MNSLLLALALVSSSLSLTVSAETINLQLVRSLPELDVIDAKVERVQINASRGDLAFDGYKVTLEYITTERNQSLVATITGEKLPHGQNNRENYRSVLSFSRIHNKTIDLETFVARRSIPSPGNVPWTYAKTQEFLIEKSAIYHSDAILRFVKRSVIRVGNTDQVTPSFDSEIKEIPLN